MFFLALPAASHAEEDRTRGPTTGDVVLSTADRLILEAINRINERIDNLSNELNGRIDNLWITMVGGFMRVMAFIGGLVFWDRRTFLKRAQEAYRDEMFGDRKKIEAMLAGMRKLSEQFPQVREVLKSFGLL